MMFLGSTISHADETRDITIEGLPDHLEADEEYTFTVKYHGIKNADHWFRPVFLAPNHSNRYFGLVLYENPVGEFHWGGHSGTSEQLPQARSDGDGFWEGELTAKANVQSNYYAGPGYYTFKVRRHTKSGSTDTWSNEVQIYIAYDPPPTPTLTPKPLPTPKPSPSPKPSSTPTNTNNQPEKTAPEITNESEELSYEIITPQPTRRPRIAGYAAVATGGGIIDLTATNSATTNSATDSALVAPQNKSRNYIMWLGILLTFGSIGSVGIEKIRQRIK